MIVGALLASAWLGPAMAPVAACTPEPRLDVAVVAEHHRPVVRSSYSLGELRGLAARSGGPPGRHPPLGFYAGTFGYTVEVTADKTGAPGCEPAMSVRVGMFLADRLIEIGADLPCRPAAVLSHYLAHAARDDELLGRYANRVAAALDRMSRSGLPGKSTRGNAEDAMAAAVRHTVEEQLRSYDEDRRQVLEAADNDEELARLRTACGHDL